MKLCRKGFARNDAAGSGFAFHSNVTPRRGSHDHEATARSAGEPVRQGAWKRDRGAKRQGQAGTQSKDPDKVGQAGNAKVNTTHQGYQQAR